MINLKKLRHFAKLLHKREVLNAKIFSVEMDICDEANKSKLDQYKEFVENTKKDYNALLNRL